MTNKLTPEEQKFINSSLKHQDLVIAKPEVIELLGISEGTKVKDLTQEQLNTLAKYMVNRPKTYFEKAAINFGKSEMIRLFKEQEILKDKVVMVKHDK